MKNEEKTNVMRLLESRKIPYASYTYAADPSLSGKEIAGILGEDPAFVYKTLVTQGRTGRNYVFVIPVCAELDLKKHISAESADHIFVSAGKVGFQIKISPAGLGKLIRFSFADLVTS